MANRATLHKQRSRILDILLWWEGELSNARVRKLFDIQTVRASRMLSEYRDAHPGRVRWDMARKHYVRVPTRERYGGSVNDYLALLFEEETPPTWIERLETHMSTVSPKTVVALRRAISTGSPVSIIYASMTRPEGVLRTIFPRAVVQAGRRWHVRAWCYERREYRDFVLGRIRKIGAAEVVERPTSRDAAWETLVNVRLVPHRLLSDAQAKVVRDELFDGTTARCIRVRGCLVPYVVQDMRASVSPEQRPPDYQIEVSNLGDIRKYLFVEGRS